MGSKQLELNTPYLPGLEKGSMHRKAITIELFLWTLAAAGIAMVLSGNESGQLLSTVPLGILGVYYFFSAFNLYGQKEEDVSTAQQGIRSFVAKMTFWGSAIASLGILFGIAGFEGGETMLTLGMATLMFMLLAVLIMSFKPGIKMQFHVFTYARLLLLIALTAMMQFGNGGSLA